MVQENVLVKRVESVVRGFDDIDTKTNDSSSDDDGEDEVKVSQIFNIPCQTF